MSNTARALRRFSNESIFDRREKELKMKKKSYSFRNANKTSINFFLKHKKEQSKFFDFSLLSNSTTNLLREMSTQHSIRQNLWKKILNEYQDNKEQSNLKNIINNSSKKQNLNKTNIGFNNSDMYITEINKFNEASSFSTYNKINNSLFKINIYRKNKNVLNIKQNSKEIKSIELLNNNKNDSFLKNIKNSTKNLDILRKFQNQKNIKQKKSNLTDNIYKNINNSFGLDKSKPQKYFNKLIDIKTKKIVVRKDNTNDFMDKLREFKILEYGTKINKEKKINFIENYKNNINYYDDYSRNLQKNGNLLNKKLPGKITDYMRFIYFKIEEEKKRENYLFNKIIKLREDIKHLNMKMKRKDLERSEILKWIYFQIKVKERILSIPSYYKEIIENKKKEIKNENMPNKVIRMSLKVSGKNKKFNMDGFNLRKSFKVKRLMNQSMKDLNTYKHFERNLDEGNIISDEEINKIKSYLKNPIFNEVGELMDSLDVFKNEIIFKNEDYYNLKSQIFNEKSWLLKHQSELINEKNNYEKIIKLKGIELEEIKEINNEKKLAKIDAKQNQKGDNLFMNLLNEKNKRIKYENYPLYIKINSLFETCKIFQLNIKENKDIDKKKKDSHPLIADMLYKLTFITRIIDSIFLEFKYYKEHDTIKRELIKKIKNDIDKKHKDAKNLEQKIKEKQKSIILFNKIEERNNKILFLSYRKVDKYNMISKKSQNKKIKVKNTSFFNFNI